MQKQPQSVFRVDKFVVPATAREEFLARASNIQKLLGTMSGCVQNLILEHVSGPGEFNVVTIVEWDSAEALEKAKNSVAATYKETNFNPQEMIARLGVKADIANYSLYAGA
jgi:heme-degrading monooxygenase HmoA